MGIKISLFGDTFLQNKVENLISSTANKKPKNVELRRYHLQTFSNSNIHC